MEAMSGAALRALTAKARRGHGGAGLGALIGDAYTYLLTAAVAVAMAVSGAGVLGAELDTTTPQASAGVAWLWWVGSLAALGLLLGLLARLGPVGVGAPGALWWLTTPADRPGLLRPVLAGWLAATGAIGAVIGAAVAALVGAPVGTVGMAALGGAGGAWRSRPPPPSRRCCAATRPSAAAAWRWRATCSRRSRWRRGSP